MAGVDTAGGDSISNTAVETTFASSQLAFPGYTFNTIGAFMRVHARGIYDTASSAPTLRTRLYMDATAIADTTAALQSPNISNQGWSADIDIVCVMTGSGGQLEVQGFRRANTGARSSQTEDMENTAPVSFDTSQPFTFGLTQQFNASATDNAADLRQFFCTIWSPV